MKTEDSNPEECGSRLVPDFTDEMIQQLINDGHLNGTVDDFTAGMNNVDQASRDDQEKFIRAAWYLSQNPRFIDPPSPPRIDVKTPKDHREALRSFRIEEFVRNPLFKKSK